MPPTRKSTSSDAALPLKRNDGSLSVSRIALCYVIIIRLMALFNARNESKSFAFSKHSFRLLNVLPSLRNIFLCVCENVGKVKN